MSESARVHHIPLILMFEYARLSASTWREAEEYNGKKVQLISKEPGCYLAKIPPEGSVAT